VCGDGVGGHKGGGLRGQGWRRSEDDAREAEGGEREVEGDAYVGAAPDGLSLDRKNAFEEHTTACSAVCTKSPAASDGEAKNKSFGLIRISSANRIETLAVCNEWMCCG
jgi:hypothetical protein